MPVDFSGKWHNQHTSEMDLAVAPSGTISGIYRTGVGAPMPGEPFPVVGFCSDDLIAFSVDFGKYGSLTSWVGQVILDAENNERIDTLWHLTKNIADSDEPKNMWATILAGADTFRRGPHPTGTSTVRHLPSHPLG